MEDIIKDMIKLGTDLSKVTEKKLTSLANKLAKRKPISREDARKIIVSGLKRAAKAQRVLAKELAKNANIAVKKGKKIKKKVKKAAKLK